MLYIFYIIMNKEEFRRFAQEGLLYFHSMPTDYIDDEHKKVLYAWTDSKKLAKKFMIRNKDISMFYQVEDYDTFKDKDILFNELKIVERHFSYPCKDKNNESMTIKLPVTNAEATTIDDYLISDVEVLMGIFDENYVKLFDYTIFNSKYQRILYDISYNAIYDSYFLHLDYDVEESDEVRYEVNSREELLNQDFSYGLLERNTVGIYSLLTSDFMKLALCLNSLPRKHDERKVVEK